MPQEYILEVLFSHPSKKRPQRIRRAIDADDLVASTRSALEAMAEEYIRDHLTNNSSAVVALDMVGHATRAIKQFGDTAFIQIPDGTHVVAEMSMLRTSVVPSPAFAELNDDRLIAVDVNVSLRVFVKAIEFGKDPEASVSKFLEEGDYDVSTTPIIPRSELERLIESGVSISPLFPLEDIPVDVEIALPELQSRS